MTAGRRRTVGNRHQFRETERDRRLVFTKERPLRGVSRLPLAGAFPARTRRPLKLPRGLWRGEQQLSAGKQRLRDRQSAVAPAATQARSTTCGGSSGEGGARPRGGASVEKRPSAAATRRRRNRDGRQPQQAMRALTAGSDGGSVPSPAGRIAPPSCDAAQATQADADRRRRRSGDTVRTSRASAAALGPGCGRRGTPHRRSGLLARDGRMLEVETELGASAR